MDPESPHRTGDHEFTNRGFYTGDWEWGRMHGRGTYGYVDGSTYVGEWKASKRQGGGVRIRELKS